MSVAFEQIKDQTTIGDKVVALKQGHFREQKNYTPPSSPPFKVEVFLVLISRQLEQRHNIAWRGWGKKSYILPFNLRSVKRQKAPLGRSVATSFVTDCSYSLFILFSAPTHTEFEGKVTKSHSQEVFQLSAGYPEIYSL